MSSSSFGLFANPDVASNESKASRQFSGNTAMAIGDSFNFQMGLNDTAGNVNGYKGFDLVNSSGAVIFNVNMGNSSTITWSAPGGSGTTNGNVFTAAGTNAMTFNITRLATANQYLITATPRTGSISFTQTVTLSSEITAFALYAGRLNSGDARQPYYNNFLITNSGVYSNTTTQSRALTGSGKLTVSNSSTLTLTADGNTFTGGTEILSGSTLSIGGGGSTGDISGSITNAGAVLFNRTGELSYTNAISGTGVVNKAGSGVVILSGGNSYSGATTVSNGVLRVANSSGLGTSDAGTTVINGAALALSNSISVANEALTLNGDGGGASGALRNVQGDNSWSGSISNNSAARIRSDSGTLSISGGVANAATETLYLGGGAGNITVSGTVNGSKTTGDGALFIDGTGTVSLSGNNSALTGSARINANSTVLIGNANALGTGQLTIAPGTASTIASSDGTARTLANSTTFIYSSLTLGQASGGTGGITFGAVDLGNDTAAGNTRTITTATGTSHTFGAMSGNTGNSIIKVGAGSLVLSGNSASYEGGIFIDEGTVVFSAGNLGGSGRALALGAEVGGAANATFTMAGDSLSTSRNVDIRGGIGSRTLNFSNSSGTTNTISGTLSHAKAFTVNVANSGASALLSGVLSSPGGGHIISVTGNGTLAVNNTGNTTDARWSIGSGAALAIGASRNLGADPGGYYIDKVTLAGGTLRATNGFSLNSNIGVQVTSASTISVHSGLAMTNPAVMGGTGGITKAGAGTLVLSAANTNSGKWTVSGGVLQIGADNNLGANPGSATSDAVTLAGGTLRTSAGLTLGNRGITVGSGGGTVDVSTGGLTNTAGLSGSAALTKAGAGTFTLTANNTYSGALTVGAGTVQLNRSGGASLGSVASVEVGSPATLLISQNEQVNDSAAVTLSGGTIRRGSGVSEDMGNLTLAANSALNFGGVAESSFLQFDTFSPSTFTLNVSNFLVGNQLRYNAASLAAGQALLTSSITFSSSDGFSTSWGGGVFTITAIPEPSTVAAALGLAGLLLWPARRRWFKAADRAA